jgi:hypothetical protein
VFPSGVGLVGRTALTPTRRPVAADLPLSGGGKIVHAIRKR